MPDGLTLEFEGSYKLEGAELDSYRAMVSNGLSEHAAACQALLDALGYSGLQFDLVTDPASTARRVLEEQ